MSVTWGNGGLSIELQFDKLMDDYSRELDAKVDKIAAGVALATSNKLRKQSPRGHGARHYADGWKRKKVGKRNYIVHNTTKPSLTYLLNNGHEKSNGTGFVQGDGHIDEADEWASKEFVKRVEREL